ncbi:DUF2958 domain-containing protein [Cupriavidus sp. YAF13]|uniref:DUF2958 domain-containing protein n=1 Tax=Cupriavidus sp. YAF13 TaxID=3233075 RepID=UPI003F91EA51
MENKLHTQLLQKMAGYPLGSQSEANDPMVLVKLFDVAGAATWWVTEYDPEDRIGFCYVTGMAYDEWGTVSIDELFEMWMTFATDPRRNIWRVQTTKPGIGTPRIELDRSFEPKLFSEVKAMVAKYALRASNAY